MARTSRWRVWTTLAVVSATGCATGGEDFAPSGDRDSAVQNEDSSVSDDTGAPDETSVPEDSTIEDAAAVDVVTDAAVDSTAIDGVIADTGSVDSAAPDTATPDTGTLDSGTLDTGPADTGPPDTGTPDMGTPDTGMPDTGMPDTGMPDTGMPDTGPVCAISLTYDFESGDQGFTHSPLSTFASDDPWQRGTPVGTTTCHGGTKCFSTGLTTNYSTCQTAQLVFPTLNLSSCAGSTATVQLSFWHYYDFEAYSGGKYWDGGLLQISTDGTTWTDVTTSQAYEGAIRGSYAGCSPTPLVSGKLGWSATIPGGVWKQVTYNIGATHRVAALRFRFIFGTDEGTNKRGWFIDDVSVKSLP